MYWMMRQEVAAATFHRKPSLRTAKCEMEVKWNAINWLRRYLFIHFCPWKTPEGEIFLEVKWAKLYSGSFVFWFVSTSQRSSCKRQDAAVLPESEAQLSLRFLKGGRGALVVGLTGKGGIFWVGSTEPRANLNSGNNGLSREQRGGRLTASAAHNLPTQTAQGKRTFGTFVSPPSLPLPLWPAPPHGRRRSCCDGSSQRRLP